MSPTCCDRPPPPRRCRHAGDGAPSTEMTRRGDAALTAEAPSSTSSEAGRRRLGDLTPPPAPTKKRVRYPDATSTDDQTTQPVTTTRGRQLRQRRRAGDNRRAHIHADRLLVRRSRNRRCRDHRTLTGDLQTLTTTLAEIDTSISVN